MDKTKPPTPQVATSASPSHDLFNRLVLATQKMDILLVAQNMPKSGDPHKIWPDVLKLSPQEQIDFVSRFEFFADVCSEAVANSAGLLNDLRLIWSVISKLKLRPPSGLFGFVAPTDYIEIYDPKGIQVFRNFEFCRLVTYNLQEILLYPWPDLYKREDKILGQIMTEFTRVFREGQVIADLKIDNHLAFENRSKSDRSYRVQMKYFAPLFGEGNSIPYMIAGSTIERLT